MWLLEIIAEIFKSLSQVLKRSKSQFIKNMSDGLLGVAEAMTQIATGVLLTQSQISKITKDVIADSIGMVIGAPAKDVEAKERVSEARMHINEASRIITDLKLDLEQQVHQLDAIDKEILEKKNLADHYAKLAQTNQEAFAEFRLEIEKTLRSELEAQAKKGRRLRQIVAIVIWVITLILGAALGAYLQIKMEPFVKPPAVAPETPKQNEPVTEGTINQSGILFTHNAYFKKSVRGEQRNLTSACSGGREASFSWFL